MFSRLANRISQIESPCGGGVRGLAADLFVVLSGIEPAVKLALNSGSSFPAVVSVFGRPLDVIDH